ncbi:MAG: amino acid adenylation domain-containing protein [Spirochaetes bacterium]|nr:amino acid adenylation domain-containing protein [Spirochaetota bacterium]
MQIIDTFINNIDSSISELSFIGSKNIEILTDLFKKNKRDYPLNTSFCSYLISSYSKYSINRSIKDEHRILSYQDFSNLVKKYSSYFNIKAGSGTVIAIVLDCSIDRTAIIHAIVCSGNSYLPVDPKWPKKRIEYILSNARVKVTVSDSMFRTRIPENQTIIFIEELDKLEVPDNFIVKRELSDIPIAVMYTSGSTGEPKGVSISGKGITNRLFWMQETFPIGPSDTLIHKVPYTFDVSIWELFWPFLTGAALFIPNPARHLDDNYLANVIKQEKITYVHFVPSLLKKFLQNVSTPSFPFLRGVICSGEVLEVSLLKQFYDTFPDIPLYNLYGPTEASIDVTAWSCSQEDAVLDRIPIGYPIANTRIYILDKEKHLCPPYVRGEIGIAGVNLAHGYIHNEKLTQNSFIKGDWGWGEETIYLTGDLGYYHEDYRIEYIGREDSQIKMNGIRIELSEIEKRLEKLPYINSAIVLKTNKHNLDVELNAYLISSYSVHPSQIINDLTEFLPGYMIPAHYYFFDEIPILGNGKIDKKKLLSYNTVSSAINKVKTISAKAEENRQRKGIRRVGHRSHNSKTNY